MIGQCGERGLGVGLCEDLKRIKKVAAIGIDPYGLAYYVCMSINPHQSNPLARYRSDPVPLMLWPARPCTSIGLTPVCSWPQQVRSNGTTVLRPRNSG
jgi:hypothetical protein